MRLREDAPQVLALGKVMLIQHAPAQVVLTVVRAALASHIRRSIMPAIRTLKYITMRVRRGLKDLQEAVVFLTPLLEVMVEV
jgi:hypothetical protein